MSPSSGSAPSGSSASSPSGSVPAGSSPFGPDGSADAAVPPVVLVFAGGDPAGPGALASLPADAYVIAADSGVGHARAAGRRIDLAVGDFDSVAPDDLDHAVGSGTVVERHPVAKDRTDLHLALDRAMATGAARVIVVGGGGGRLDHLLGNALVLLDPAYAGRRLEARIGDARLDVVRDDLVLVGTAGDLVTLLAVTGPVHGIVTEGLAYPLRGESLLPGSSRGISNEQVAAEATVAVAEGALLVVRPGRA